MNKIKNLSLIKKILLVIFILFASLVIFFLYKVHNAPRDGLKDRWKIDLSNSVKVEEIYTNTGWFGEGSSVFKLSNISKLENITQDNKYLKKTNTKLADINDLIFRFGIAVNIENIEILQDFYNDGDKLIICYDRENDVYYLFEEII